jgi:hypothetical protein
MIDVTVKVPEDRVAEFYTMYGQWLSGALSPAPEPTVEDAEVSEWSSGDVELAQELWNKFNDRAKALFTTLLENPGQRFTGQELAERLNIPNGSNGVAGVLAWPGRYCKQYGRTICWHVDWSDDAYVAVYWLEGVLADLFRKASGV